MGDIGDGDGHGAIHSVLGTAGTYQQQLADLETRLANLKLKDRADYVRFSKVLGRIDKNWQHLYKNTDEMDASDNLTEGRKKRVFLEKIKKVFDGIYRDSKRAGNNDTVKEMHAVCMDLARDAQREADETVARANASVKKDGATITIGVDVLELLKQKIKDLEARADSAHTEKKIPICDICRQAGHVKRWCASKGGPFETDGIDAALAAKRKFMMDVNQGGVTASETAAKALVTMHGGGPPEKRTRYRF